MASGAFAATSGRSTRSRWSRSTNKSTRERIADGLAALRGINNEPIAANVNAESRRTKCPICSREVKIDTVYQRLVSHGMMRTDLRSWSTDNPSLPCAGSWTLVAAHKVASWIENTGIYKARKLARAILDRSRSEDECNTIEDAVSLAKLVLGE